MARDERRQTFMLLEVYIFLILQKTNIKHNENARNRNLATKRIVILSNKVIAFYFQQS